jgi:hypothetical protein
MAMPLGVSWLVRGWFVSVSLMSHQSAGLVHHEPQGNLSTRRSAGRKETQGNRGARTDRVNRARPRQTHIPALPTYQERVDPWSGQQGLSRLQHSTRHNRVYSKSTLGHTLQQPDRAAQSSLASSRAPNIPVSTSPPLTNMHHTTEQRTNIPGKQSHLPFTTQHLNSPQTELN